MSLTDILLAGLVVGAVTNPSAALRLPSDIVEATVCDLAQHPLEFENRHVRVRGTLETGPEYFGLGDDACPSANSMGAGIWLDFQDDDEIFKYYRGWSAQRFVQAAKLGELHGDGPAVSWQTPVPLAPLDPKQKKCLLSASDEAQHRAPSVIITGRFDYAGGGLLVKSSQGPYSYKAAFGHLNCCTGRIVLEQVEVLDNAR